MIILIILKILNHQILKKRIQFPKFVIYIDLNIYKIDFR